MLLKSRAVKYEKIELPLYAGHLSMIKFDLHSLNGLPCEFHNLVKNMLKNIKEIGYAYFTIHGEQLKKGETLRRPGAHIDGNFEPCSWGNGGWKIGENGNVLTSDEHKQSYESINGGIILASNFYACDGWIGDFKGHIGIGGDCSSFDLSKNKFKLEPNTIYYGNNHFIHESLPMYDDCHRVLVRITLPQYHVYKGR